MKVQYDLTPRSARPTVIALGLFDGLHLGHRAVIRKAVQLAHELDAEPSVFTFTMQNSRPAKKQGQGKILPDTIKNARYAQLGVETVYMPDFDSFKDCAAAAFVKDILIQQLHAVHIVCGYDFRFGAGAAGNSTLLQAIAEQHGCAVTVLPAMLANGAAISSTHIRTLLAEGEIEQANTLLGDAYAFDFTVSSGKQLGHKLGFPTINQEYPDGFVLPKFGVYAAVATVHGVDYPAVTNIGVKPTVGGVERPLAETYIVGVDADLYGEQIEVTLKRFLRAEQKFPSLEALKSAIAENARQAQEIFDTSR